MNYDYIILPSAPISLTPPNFIILSLSLGSLIPAFLSSSLFPSLPFCFSLSVSLFLCLLFSYNDPHSISVTYMYKGKGHPLVLGNLPMATLSK